MNEFYISLTSYLLHLHSIYSTLIFGTLKSCFIPLYVEEPPLCSSISASGAAFFWGLSSSAACNQHRGSGGVLLIYGVKERRKSTTIRNPGHVATITRKHGPWKGGMLLVALKLDPLAMTKQRWLPTRGGCITVIVIIIGSADFLTV